MLSLTSPPQCKRSRVGVDMPPHSSRRNVLLFSTFASFLGLLHLSSSLFVSCHSVQDSPDISPENSDPEKISDELISILGMDVDEMKRRLNVLYPMIDENGDGIISRDELTSWMAKIKEAVSQKQMLVEMESIDKDGDNKVSFHELQVAYLDSSDGSDAESVKELRKRFDTVDKDQDGSLTLHEVGILMNPGRDPEMMKLEIDEILASQDKDNDRKISMEEFFAGADPDIPEEEKEQFASEFKVYDLNGDGYIDEVEIGKVVADPHVEEVKDSVDEVMKLVPDQHITKEYYEEMFHKLVVSSLTDSGEILRFPADYNLGIPLENLPKTDEEELIHEEL